METPSDNILREVFHMLCREHIGTGSTRMIWTSELLPDRIIKVEDGERSFQNIVEWETWKYVEDTKFAKWFAPCRYISPNGSVLVMDKTAVPGMSDLPELMPAFLCDFKRSNYGILNGQLVCHDYGLLFLATKGLTMRMQKVKWHDNVTGILE